MTAPTRGTLTRGPLPSRVYWRRRLAVLGVAVLLVVGFARLLGSGSDGSSGDGAAELADAPVSATSGSPSSTSSATPSATASATPSVVPTPTAPTSTAPVLAVPTGPCDDSDIAVTPEVTAAVAGPRHGVTIALELRTISAEACTWTVSPRTLTLKITSGTDDIWSSRECPRVLPRQSVTVRRAVSTTLSVEWNARRSDEECSKLTAWAMPGYYHVSAAALAGEPSEVQFELLAPPPVVVTRTPEPEGKGTTKGKKAKAKPSTPTEEPASTGEPSGAVEPNAD